MDKNRSAEAVPEMLPPVPFLDSAAPPAAGPGTITPELREKALRECLPSGIADRLLADEAARRPPTRGDRLLFLLTAALVVLVMWINFPVDRLRPQLRTRGPIAPDAIEQEHRKRFEQAREAADTGRNSEADALIAPLAAELIGSRDAERIRRNEALLELRWELLTRLRHPVTVVDECRQVLEFAPDAAAARVFLAETEFPFRSFAELERQNGRSPRRLREAARPVLELLAPLCESPRLTLGLARRATYDLALAKTAIWLAEGGNDDPGDPGFIEREEALALTRACPDDLEHLTLRCDILRKIWQKPWFFWNYQMVEGTPRHHRDLKREIDELTRTIEATKR